MPSKLIPRSQLNAWLVEGARRLGLELTPPQLQQFIIYIELLLQWGRTINLTSILAPQAIIDRHFCDSLALWSVVPPPTGGHLLDIGAGAGFPGVPLKIMAPSIELTLLEPRHKRAAFLQVLLAKLGLRASRVVTMRLADLPTTTPCTWIVARGVGRLEELVAQADGCLAPGGGFAFYLSREQSTEKLRRLSGFQLTDHRYRLPFSAIEHRVCILRRQS